MVSTVCVFLIMQWIFLTQCTVQQCPFYSVYTPPLTHSSTLLSTSFLPFSFSVNQPPINSSTSYPFFILQKLPQFSTHNKATQLSIIEILQISDQIAKALDMISLLDFEVPTTFVMTCRTVLSGIRPHLLPES